MSITIDVDDTAVQAALEKLQGRLGKISPLLQAIGEDIMERTKQRFSTSRGPDGAPWPANSRATYEALAHKRGQFRKTDGKLSAKSTGLLATKNPLIGESRNLANQFVVNAQENSLLVGSTMKYAAMQQFGGKKSQFPHLWGDIPARPFLPITPSGTLYPDEKDKILAALRDAFE
ncbi:MAG: phage virion morphogenesis protein [Sterolibacterium sp.]|nr:phage virion morphogenesis protein [Sterolibacterium sp.]